MFCHCLCDSLGFIIPTKLAFLRKKNLFCQVLSEFGEMAPRRESMTQDWTAFSSHAPCPCIFTLRVENMDFACEMILYSQFKKFCLLAS